MSDCNFSFCRNFVVIARLFPRTVSRFVWILWELFLLHEPDYWIQPLATIRGQDVGHPVPERAQADNRGTPLIWIRALKRPNRGTPLIWIRALKRPPEPEKCWANSDDRGGFSRRGAGQKPATVCSTLQPHATACVHTLSLMLALPSPVWCWGDREGWIRGQDVGQPVPERAQADNRGTPLIWIRALKRPPEPESIKSFNYRTALSHLSRIAHSFPRSGKKYVAVLTLQCSINGSPLRTVNCIQETSFRQTAPLSLAFNHEAGPRRMAYSNASMSSRAPNTHTEHGLRTNSTYIHAG